MEWEKKTVLITGASSGIGEALAQKAAREGSHLVLVARREEALAQLAVRLKEAHPEIQINTVAADICSEEDRMRILSTCEAIPKGLHILVHNAGITAHGRFDQMEESVLRNTMEVNFFAPARLTALLIPLLKKSTGEKVIVYVSTPSGYHGIPERSAYSASKAAGNMLMETLRFELESWQIRTLIFAPGYTKTALRTSGLGPDGKVISEEQAKGAKSPEYVAEKLIRAVKKRKRNAFTDLNGRAVYWLRTLAPNFLYRKIKSRTGA